MKVPTDIDGKRLVAHLTRRWAYVQVRQSGSHIRLRTGAPHEHHVTVPAHSPVKPGTLRSIVKDVAEHKGVPMEDVLVGL